MKKWTLVGLSITIGALTIFLLFKFFLILFRFKKAVYDEDEQGKARALKSILAVSIGFVLCLIIAIVLALFGTIILNK